MSSDTLVFGYGQKRDGTLNEQTQNRCQKALSLYKRGKTRRIYLTVGVEKAGIKMADAMREYMVANGANRNDVVVEPRGYNTAGEMDVFLSLVRSSEYKSARFISTWYHLPRIVYLALWRISPRRIRLGIAWKHAHPLKDVAIEFLKMGNAIMRPLSWSKVSP